MAQGVNSYSQAVDASGRWNLPADANFFYLISSTAALAITLWVDGRQEVFSNAIGGLQLGRVKPWTQAFITAAPGTVITLIYGGVFLREDVTILQQQIATVAGTVTTTTAPASTIATPAALAVANASATTVAANLLRRRITFCSPSTNSGSVFLQAVGAGAGRGIELQAGIFIEIDNTAAIDIRNDSGAVQTITTFEET